MATMLTVARRIAQMHKTRRGLAMMGFDLWAGKAFWRGLRLRAKDWPYQSKLAFGGGKSQSWTCMFRTSFCFSPLEIVSRSTDGRPNFMQAAIVQFHRE